MLNDINNKKIFIDYYVKDFRAKARTLRTQKNLTPRDIYAKTGVNPTVLSAFETSRGRVHFRLRTLIKLAEAIGYDLSSSLNYRFFHGNYSVKKFEAKLEYYGLSYKYLEELTGISIYKLRAAVRRERDGTVRNLAIIVSILYHEIKAEEQEMAQNGTLPVVQ